ncbi:MAG: hypothetical protein KTR31_22820 [Myxococcales bacterium]|nr:hypothetical protein [Myxococcales bacterium]
MGRLWMLVAAVACTGSSNIEVAESELIRESTQQPAGVMEAPAKVFPSEPRRRADHLMAVGWSCDLDQEPPTSGEGETPNPLADTDNTSCGFVDVDPTRLQRAMVVVRTQRLELWWSPRGPILVIPDRVRIRPR